MVRIPKFATILAISGLLFPGCDNPAEPAAPTMPAKDLLIRASLDLRGVRPSVAELDAVEADPTALDGLIEDFLADERFGARVRDLFADTYRTRTETYAIGADAYGLSDEAAFYRAIGEEPLRILSEIATNDLPYTTLVTADWTMSDEVLAEVWPVDYPAGVSGWQRVHYMDGRPSAGILSTNAMWWRYTSTASNANRARANAVSRILLCNDYLSRPIHFDRNVNLLDEQAVNEALQTNPSCVNCHNSLDPLAGYFYGFFYYSDYDADEARVYHAERERLWQTYSGIEPGYYGEPSYNLHDLGQQIAGDHRFAECAVEQVYEALLRREVTIDDTDALVRHRDAFIDGGLTLRALFRSVVQDPNYRAGPVDEAGAVPLKMATPELLASEVEALTGYRMVYQGYDLMSTDMLGFRTLAGGADGYNVTQAATSPNTTTLLVQERLAQSAAWYVAQQEAEGGSPRVFTEVNFSETPESGRDAMVRQIQALHYQLFGDRVAADGPEVTANLELWSDLYAVQHDTVGAWAGVLSVLLRDPDFLFY